MPPKRKPDGEAAGAPKPKKMSREEKAAARERARLAMEEDSSAPKKKTATPSKPKAAPKAAAPSPARKTPKKAAAKSTTAKSAAKAKVTIKEEDTKPAPMEVPLPPTSLQRTQSTPLELELEHQVVANLKADMEGKEPVFTSAPPEHLLKFAPTELEEGYDHDESNAAPIEGGEDAEKSAPRMRPSAWPTLTSSLVLEVCVIALWMYLFWGREGAFYHRWTHGVLSRIPLWGNPYRINGKPLPFLPCFGTNIDDPPIPMRSECIDIPPVDCPEFGECYGGELQMCQPPYLRVAPNGKTCGMEASVQKIFDHVVDQLDHWTMDHQCDRKSYAKLFEQYEDSPRPALMFNFRETNPPMKQPMFALEYILDMEPFLLMKLPHGGHGRSPTQTLYHVLETANSVADGWLKLQIYTTPGEVIEGTEERQAKQSHLIARVPSKQNWWRSKLSLSGQCTLMRTKASLEYAARTPWLVGVWVACMIIFVIWAFVMRHYWMKAQQQQQVLAAIEVMRHFVLETLESSAPKQWKGPELLEFVVRSGAPVEDEQLLRKRIWPRVVFDIRGNPNVAKSVIVSGANLIDVWVWQPREEQAAAQAPNETGGA